MAVIDNLVSYWSLDEASGNALDAHSSNDLTDNNTVGAGTGVVSGARDFEVDNGEYFSHSDSADFSVGDIDFTFAVWIKIESTSSNRHIICKATASDLAYDLFYYAGTPGLIVFRVCSGNSFANQTDVYSSSVDADTWYYVVAWHDAANNQICIQINNSTPSTQGYAFGSYDDTGDFNLGAYPVYGANFDGLLDEACFWKRVLTGDERTWLYNSGAGRSYADIVAEAGGGDQTLTPGAVTAAWTAPASTISASAVTLSPLAVAASWVLAASTLLGNGAATLSPSAVTSAWQVPASTISASPVTLSPSAVTSAWTIPASDVSAVSVTLNPAAVTAAWAEPVSTISAVSVTLSPDAVTSAWAIPASDISASPVTLSPAAVTAAWAIPASDIAVSGGPQTLFPSPVTATWAIPAGDVQGSGSSTLSPSAVTSVWTIPASTISASAVTLTPSAVTSAWATPDSTISATTVTLAPSPVTATWTTPPSTFTGSGAVTLSPSAVTSTWAVPASEIGAVSPSTLSVTGTAITLLPVTGSVQTTITGIGTYVGTISVTAQIS